MIGKAVLRRFTVLNVAGQSENGWCGVVADRRWPADGAIIISVSKMPRPHSGIRRSWTRCKERAKWDGRPSPLCAAAADASARLLEPREITAGDSSARTPSRLNLPPTAEESANKQ